MMIFVFLGALFLLSLLFIPIYFFWIKEKHDEIDQKDEGQSDV